MINGERGRTFSMAAILAILLVAVACWSVISTQSHQQPLIKVDTFEIEPSGFKSTESAELLLKVENLALANFTNVAVYFETHENVKIYEGDTILSRSGGNYSFTKSLDPGEISGLKFTVTASLDVGDNSRSYYIRGYIYANAEFSTVREVTFVVERG